MDEWCIECMKATLVLLTEQKPRYAEALFVHARSKNDEQEALHLVASVCKTLDYTPAVILNGSGGINPDNSYGWDGCTAFSERLASLGVKTTHITRPAYNTREENEAFFEKARELAYQSVFIVALPHQVLRSMMGFVKVMAERRLWMDVWTIAPASLDWNRVVTASHGVTKPRIDHVEEELIRIKRYQERGHLCTFPELWEYLKRRDEDA